MRDTTSAEACGNCEIAAEALSKGNAKWHVQGNAPIKTETRW